MAYRPTYNQSQALSTLTGQKVPVEEYPTCNKNQRHDQQLFEPRVFIVSGLRYTTAHCTLFKYMKSMTAGNEIEKVTLLGEGRAVAEVGKDISGFQKLKSKIRSHKLEGMQLKILRVYACDSIFVSGLSPAVTRDTILLYFENVLQSGGDKVHEVALCKATNCAVVTFLNPEVICKVVQKEHIFESQKLTVKKYFPQIDMKNINVLSGVISLESNDEEEKILAQNYVKPTVHVKRPCTLIAVDDDVMQFIRIGVHVRELERKLDELNAEIEWNTGRDRVTIWKKTDSSCVKSWASSCETVLDEFFDRFSKCSLAVKELKEPVQNAVIQALPRLTEVIPPEKALCKQVEEKQELLVVCLDEESVSVLQSVAEFVEKIKKEEIRKIYQKETVRDISHDRLLFLKHIGFVEKIKEKNPELEVTLDLEKRELNFQGPCEQFTSAKIIYCQTMKEMSEKILNLPSGVASIVDELLAQENISAILLPKAGGAMKIIAGTSWDCERAINCLCASRKVPFPSGHNFIFERKRWKKITEILKSQQLIQLNIDHVTNSIILQGVTYIVEIFEKEITEFVESQRIKERKKVVSLAEARFLRDHLSIEISGIEARLKNDQVTIELKEKYPMILFRGTNSGLERSIRNLNQMVAKMRKELSSPGLSELLFSKNGQRYLKVIEIENSVVFGMIKRSRKDVKVESLRVELKEEKKSTYDLCNFTTAKGLRVSWKYGNIADETADILVNSAHSDLSNPTACGDALNKVGGPSFIQVCRDHGSIKKGNVVHTSGGNLSCKHVLHAVCCSWDSYQGKSEELLRGLVHKILSKCTELRATSLAIPAIGTGQHGFPDNVVFKVFKEEIQAFSSFSLQRGAAVSLSGFRLLRSRNTLQEVRVIVYQASGSSTHASQPVRYVQVPSSITPVVSNSCVVSFGTTVRVSLHEGDITQQRTAVDAIVNVLPDNLQLNSGGGVCKSILNSAGGQFIQQQLDDAVGVTNPGSIVCTNAGSMPNTNWILHFTPTSTDLVNLQRAIEDCLNEAISNNLSSVSIPAIGTASFGISPRDSATLILNAAKSIASFNYAMDVRIVVFQKNMVPDFEAVLQEQAKANVQAVHNAPATQSLNVATVSSHYDRKGIRKPAPKRTSSVQTLKTKKPAPIQIRKPAPKRSSVQTLKTGEAKEVVVLNVFASSQRNIDTSLEEVTKFIEEHSATKKIEHENVFDVLVEHWSEVEDLARDHHVSITCSKSSSVAEIEGMVANVSDCKDNLSLLITKHVEEKRKISQVEFISKNVQWCYTEGSQTVPYDNKLNAAIEMAYMENQETLDVTKNGDRWEIDLIANTETNQRSGQVETITRKQMGGSSTGLEITVPSHWSKQPSTQLVHLVTLQPSCQEYQQVLVHFTAMGGITNRIIKIERVQNPGLYKAYLVKKQSMKGAENEQQLFHGTSDSNIVSINANNFDRSFAGTNGVMYGNGVYFARDAKYSLAYSTSECNSYRHIYVVKVLVGKFTAGHQGMKAPPARNDPSNPGLLFDSVVDNVNNPSIFVIFNDHQCYPEYLITFT